MPPASFGHWCDHLLGGALQRAVISRYYRSLWITAQIYNIKFKSTWFKMYI